MSIAKKGRKLSEETRKKISEAHKGRYGKPQTEEARKKISEAQKVAVICVEIGQSFDSIKEASETVKVNRGHIGQCCLGYRKTAGGYHWKYKQ